jgi:thioredoxin reductase (NADPH)
VEKNEADFVFPGVLQFVPSDAGRTQPWQDRHGFALDVVDVDADPVLEARFNELVPVLMDGEHEICHWHLDIPALAAHLGEIG